MNQIEQDNQVKVRLIQLCRQTNKASLVWKKLRGEFPEYDKPSLKIIIDEVVEAKHGKENR